MATITKFEDLEVWKRARQLAIRVHELNKMLNASGEYELKKQMDRSAGSVMDNIAEGFERGGNKEFIQFLYISKGSVSELRCQLHRAYDRKILDEETFSNVKHECILISSKLSAFINYLKRTEFKGQKYQINNVE